MHFIQSNIPDIVSLALEDNNEDIRAIALNFLINLCDDGKAQIYSPIIRALTYKSFSHVPFKDKDGATTADGSAG